MLQSVGHVEELRDKDLVFTIEVTDEPVMFVSGAPNSLDHHWSRKGCVS